MTVQPETLDPATKRHVTSVGKALRLLTAFQEISPPVGLSELARLTGLPKSTAFRFLADLEQVGFVERDGTEYRLGLPLFELGNKVPICRPNGLRDSAMHTLSRLHSRTGLSVHLGVLEGADVVHIAKVNQSMQMLPGHLLRGRDDRRPAPRSGRRSSPSAARRYSARRSTPGSAGVLGTRSRSCPACSGS